MPKSLADFVEEAKETVTEMSPEQALLALQSGGWMLLDVREPDEFGEGRLPGAINIPRGFLEVRADHFHHKRDPRLQDRQKKIICYCGGGNRSLLAARTLLEMGFAQAVSIEGGWSRWQEEGLPTEVSE